MPAFADNYIRMLQDERNAIVVDPGDAAPVFDAISRGPLQLAAILVTHHHADRTGGVAALREAATHESAPANLRFAQAVEPGNTASTRYTAQCEALGARGGPTLPLATVHRAPRQPFLRSREATVLQAVRAHAGLSARSG